MEMISRIDDRDGKAHFFPGELGLQSDGDRAIQENFAYNYLGEDTRTVKKEFRKLEMDSFRVRKAILVFD